MLKCYVLQAAVLSSILIRALLLSDVNVSMLEFSSQVAAKGSEVKALARVWDMGEGLWYFQEARAAGRSVILLELPLRAHWLCL